MIIAMIDDTIEEIVRTAVIGVLSFARVLNCCFGLDRFPPDLKYITITTIEDITHANVRDNAVLFVGETLINVVLNNKNKIKILEICSINSVMLIAKNCFCPQSAPLNTS